MIYLRKFFDEPIKNFIKTFENIQNISSGQRDDWTTGCLLEYKCFKKNYKKIRIDLSKQQNPCWKSMW